MTGKYSLYKNNNQIIFGTNFCKRSFFNTPKKNVMKLYDILECPQDASQTEIKKSFFKLAKQYHPDVNKAKDAQAKYVEINE